MKKKCVAGLEIMKCPFWKEKVLKELKVWRKKYGGLIKNEERKGVKNMQVPGALPGLRFDEEGRVKPWTGIKFVKPRRKK